MSNKHLPHDLKQMQSLPLEAKIIMTQQRIRQWYDHWDGMVYVSVSGIDSSVLKHIIDQMYDDVPALFVNTGLEYPELQKFWREVKKGKYPCFNSDVEILRPEMTFPDVVKNYGYPVGSKETADKIEFGRKALDRGDTYYYEYYVEGKRINPETGEKYTFVPLAERFKPLFEAREIPVSQRCCSVMKKKPLKTYAKKTGRKAIIGTMADESRLRYQKWMKEGCNAFNSKDPTSKPLSFWTKQDILHYAKKYDVPYPSVYGDIVVDDGDDDQINIIDYLGAYEDADTLTTTGCDRTGCIFCMFGITQDRYPNRFQRLKETHPRQYEYCIGGGEMVDGTWQPNKQGLGLGKVLDYIGVDYK